MREILITATVLILCILLIRRIFRGKISSRLQYALWLLAALRLVIPVSAQFDIGSLSDFRLMDLVEEESNMADRLEETIHLEEPIQMTMNSQSIWFRLFADEEVKKVVRDAADDGPTSVFLAGTFGFSGLDVLRFLWRIGALIVGVCILATNILFSRRLRKTRQPFALPEEVKTAVLGNKGTADGEEKRGHILGTKDRLPAFYLAEGISSPCLYGFPGREAVYLTADVAGDVDRLRHVVVHELVHRKHGDSFWALLRGVLVTVYWFHPLVWVAAVCSKRDCELACDEEALVLLGEEERIPYGETLLSIITKKARVSDLMCTATTMTGSGKSVKERIQFIAKEPKIFYAAVAAALFLIAAICLFVFTKDARFNGITVDAQEGLTVTGADMQIALPVSIGGISGCVVEKESDDIVIYHIAAQEEVGRFSQMPLKDALELVDEGREVLPIGEYGYNYLLRAYMGEPLSRTEHTYMPAADDSSAEQAGGVLSHEDVYMSAEQTEKGNLLTETITVPDASVENSTEYNYTAVEEERYYLPESITVAEPGDGSVRVTDHTYTPNLGEEEASGTDSHTSTAVSGTDSNDDTTYIIEDGKENGGNPLLSEERELIPLEEDDQPAEEVEDKVDYLPNEQIVTTTYQPAEVNVDELQSGCYVYVRADFYGKVKEKYQEEMRFIDEELKAAADQVIILSLNRERREALFDVLTKNRTPYVGDNSKVGALVNALPLPPTLIRSGGFSMQTVKRPYSLRFDYEMSTDYFTQEDRDMLYFNAAMLFYAVGNVEEISMKVRNPSGAGSAMMVYYREELEKELPGLQNADYEDDSAFREGLSELHVAVETYLSAAAR